MKIKKIEPVNLDILCYRCDAVLNLEFKDLQNDKGLLVSLDRKAVLGLKNTIESYLYSVSLDEENKPGSIQKSQLVPKVNHSYRKI